MSGRERERLGKRVSKRREKKSRRQDLGRLDEFLNGNPVVGGLSAALDKQFGLTTTTGAAAGSERCRRLHCREFHHEKKLLGFEQGEKWTGEGSGMKSELWWASGPLMRTRAVFVAARNASSRAQISFPPYEHALLASFSNFSKFEVFASNTSCCSHAEPYAVGGIRRRR